MSRRRYLSTDISTDPKVTRLAQEHGDFAALLYTWMIPHAGDDCTITADPDQIILMVVPGWRHKTADDIRAALDGMLALGLIQPDADPRKLYFPPTSFYRYQTYIKPANRRKTAAGSAPVQPGQAPAENAAQQRETPQNTASVKPSLPPSPPPSHSPSPPAIASGETGAPVARAREAPAAVAAPPANHAPKAVPKARELPADLVTLQASFEERGLRAPPLVSSAEQLAAKRLLKLAREPDALAACWQDIRAGDYGDEWTQQNVSFVTLEQRNRFVNWQDWKEGRNGTHASTRNGAQGGSRRGGGKPRPGDGPPVGVGQYAQYSQPSDESG